MHITHKSAEELTALSMELLDRMHARLVILNSRLEAVLAEARRDDRLAGERPQCVPVFSSSDAP